jgi:hypothetical protein
LDVGGFAGDDGLPLWRRDAYAAKQIDTLFSFFQFNSYRNTKNGGEQQTAGTDPAAVLAY